jgi:hypothetical protein
MYKPLLFLILFGISSTINAEPLQTQIGMSGDLEVDVNKAGVLDNILTVVLVYRNTGTARSDVKYKVADVYYIDDADSKKYHVLKDSKNEWIGAPIARGSVGIGHPGGVGPLAVDAGGKKIVWFKFPAPPATAQTINLVVPDVLPFEELAISR